MIKNTFSNRSENPESLNKQSQQFNNSLINVHILGDNLLRASTSCFNYGFVIQVMS